MSDDSVFGAMERLRLGAIAGLDRLEAHVEKHRDGPRVSLDPPTPDPSP